MGLWWDTEEPGPRALRPAPEEVGVRALRSRAGHGSSLEERAPWPTLTCFPEPGLGLRGSPEPPT